MYIKKEELKELLIKLKIQDKKIVNIETEEIHSIYNVDYFEEYKL